MKIIIKMSLLSFFINLFNPMIQAGQGEKVDYAAPVVTALNQDKESVNFADLYQKGPVVVFFYPKANTPGCTKQACSLRDAFADLSKEGVQVLGVSTDSPEAQKKFIMDHQLPYSLIADEDKKVCEAFKVPTLAGFAQRQCFLIKGGKVVWHDAKASTAQQAEDIRRELAK
jgi:peroxiredoxin Q/BCP